MHFVEKEPLQKRIDFNEKLKTNKILRVPGAYNPLTAKLIEEIGYDAVYVSGGVMANDLGFPDIGLTTLQDVSTRSYLISRVTNLPTIVDIDTGFKSCKETVETFEEFGITGVHLEDQIERKRCGHLDNKELISREAMEKNRGVSTGRSLIPMRSAIFITWLTMETTDDSRRPSRLRKGACSRERRRDGLLHRIPSTTWFGRVGSRETGRPIKPLMKVTSSRRTIAGSARFTPAWGLMALCILRIGMTLV